MENTQFTIDVEAFNNTTVGLAESLGITPKRREEIKDLIDNLGTGRDPRGNCPACKEGQIGAPPILKVLSEECVNTNEMVYASFIFGTCCIQ